MTLDGLLACLENVRRSGTGWSARCPSHEDRRNSLSIRQDGDKLLLKCLAGCRTEDVLDRLGLKMSDLFEHPSSNGHGPTPTRPQPSPDGKPGGPLDWLASYCGVPLDFLKSLPLAAEGEKAAFTFEGLAVRKLRPAGQKAFTWQPAGSSTPPLWPMPGPTLPSTVWLCEGESDAVVGRHVGLPAYALTKGAGSPLTAEQAASLKHRGATIAVVCFDADQPGREGATKLGDALAAAGLTVKVVDLAAAGLADPLLGQKDLRDAWLRLRDAEALREQLERAATEAPTFERRRRRRYEADDEPDGDALGFLIGKLGLPVERVIRRGERDAIFELCLGGERLISLGRAEDLLNPRRARVAIAEGAGKVIPLFKDVAWQPVAQAVLDAAELVEVPDQAVVLAELVESYADATGHQFDLAMPEGRVRALTHGESAGGLVDRSFWAAQGEFYLHTASFLAWYSFSQRSQLSVGLLSVTLSRLGFEAVRLQERADGRKLGRRYWRSPAGWHGSPWGDDEG